MPTVSGTIVSPSVIRSWSLESYELPAPRILGDVHDRIEALPIGALTLESTTGQTGLGFFWSPSYPHPAPPLNALRRSFEQDVAPGLLGRSPFELSGRVTRPRSFAARRHLFSDAVDLALWDLQGKELGLPVYRLLGGDRNRLTAYASGLDYHLSIDEAQTFFAQAASEGFTAFKVKVGRRTVAEDIIRLRAVADAVGPDALILVDANEAWSPKETLRRTHAFLDAGVNLFWVEDPCIRDDLDALAALANELPVHLCLGDYLDTPAKIRAIERRACDIVRIGDHLTDGMRVGWLAAEHGVPIVIHNSLFDLGIHLGLALPGVLFMEYSFLGYEQLADTAIRCEAGAAVAPDTPGHGVSLNAAARTLLAAAA